jgi:hypothetical protein
MDIEKMVEGLYSKDNKEAYSILLELEQISDNGNFLYNYFNEFFQMIYDKKYFIKIRGFRLLCKQAKWDKEDKINKNIDKILLEIEDEKPIAVRQKLQAMESIIHYKPELNNKIQEKIKKINYLTYKESMQGLILNDIQNLLTRIDKENKKK